MQSIINRSLKLGLYFLGILIPIIAISVIVIASLTPNLNKNKIDFESRLTAVLKMPVNIERAKITWYRYQPVITFYHTIIRDPNSHEPLLEINKMRIFLSLIKSLWERKAILSGVMIDGLDLSISLAKNREITIRGFPVLKEFQTEPFKTTMNFPAILAWISFQPHITLQNINISYDDFTQKPRMLRLNNFQLNNGLFSHYAQGDVILLQELNTQVNFTLNWKGTVDDIQNIEADAYLHVSGLALSQWLGGLSWKNWQIEDGVGSFKTWVSWRKNSIEKIQTLFRFYNLNFIASGIKEHLLKVSGHVGWKKEGDRQIIAGDDLILDLPNEYWPVNRFYLAYENKPPQIKAFNVNYFNLNKVPLILSVFRDSLSVELKNYINSFLVSGNIRDLMITDLSLNAEKMLDALMVKFDLDSGVLHFASEWPSLREVNALMTLNKGTMRVAAKNAKILDIPLENIIATITDFNNPILNIHADPIHGNFNELEDLVLKSPLIKSVGELYNNLNLEGNLLSSLQLMIPLYHLNDISVKGEIEFKNALLQVLALNLSIQNLAGRFSFDKETIKSDVIRGKLLNESFEMKLDTLKNGKMITTFSTQVPLNVLADKYKFKRNDFVAGKLPLAGEISIVGSRLNAIQMKSSMQGVALKLFPPFTKNINDIKPMNLKITYPSNGNANYTLNYAKSNFVLKESAKENWLLSITSPIAIGKVTWPKKLNANSVFEANFESILWPQFSKPSRNFDIDPNQIPGFDLDVKYFNYKGDNANSIHIEARKIKHGLDFKNILIDSKFFLVDAQGQWVKINQQPFTQFKGEAKSNRLNELLETTGVDAHNLVAKQGEISFDVYSPKNPMDFTITDMNGALYLYIGKGRIINLSDAENAKIGLGKMLSLFSLQSIPRRLSFDFSDIHEKGFSFDLIEGDFIFKAGNAYTNNLKINGSVARIDIQGNISFVNKDFDLTLSIIPSVTSSLPLAAVLINPYIGIAAWGVNKLLGSPVSRITTFSYQVEGPWSNPTWTPQPVRGDRE